MVEAGKMRVDAALDEEVLIGDVSSDCKFNHC